MSFLGRLHQARAELAERSADPWRKKLEDAVRGKETVSTSALLELLGVPKTTGNARRIAKTMRSLEFVPIKSRRLMPGGFRDTVARGWARAIRETKYSPLRTKQTGTTRANEKGAIMKYLLQRYSDEYHVINEVSDAIVARVRPLQVGLGSPKFEVYDDKEIAVVNSIDEVIPATAAYYQKNPPRWEPESDYETYGSKADAPARCGPRFVMETQFGPLWVDQIKPRQWLAYRNHHELLSGGKIAIFATCEEARRVADAHLRDGYPNSEIISDGFSWRPDPDIDWRTDPYRVAARARLAVDA